jgi:hypothetical protein
MRTGHFSRKSREGFLHYIWFETWLYVRLCYRLNCVSWNLFAKEHQASKNMTSVRDWVFETVMKIKWGHCNWLSFHKSSSEENKTQACTNKRPRENTRRQSSPSQGERLRANNQRLTFILEINLQNHEKMNLYILSHPVHSCWL